MLLSLYIHIHMQSSFKVFSAIQFCEFILHKYGKYIYVEIEYFHLTGIYCYCFKQITFIIDVFKER